MVIYVIRNNRFYKSSDILNESYKERMNNYFNPYEYNLESNLKDLGNTDHLVMKSKNHEIRNKIKK